jgi:malate permease and related proteins
MTNFVLIIVCMLLGWVVRRIGILPKDAHRGFNFWILYVAFPAIIIKYLPAVHWELRTLFTSMMPLIVIIAGIGFIQFFARIFKIEKRAAAALMLTACWGNTSFVGFPLVQAFYGSEGMSVAVIYDQINFISLSTLGIILAGHAAHDQAGKASLQAIARRVLSFPPFVASVIALTVPRFIDCSPAQPLLESLGATLIPLALFSVGLQLSLSNLKNEGRALALGLSYKLFLAPLIVLGFAMAFHLKGLHAQVTIIEAAMAPIITGAVVASEFHLEPRLANLMAGIGIPISLITTTLWWLLLKAMG